MSHRKFSSKVAIAPLITLLTTFPVVVVAQDTIPNPSNNIDNLPNDPQQLTTWRCTQEDQAIAVEAKDIKGWQEMIEKEGWQCQEELSIIPSGDRQFSCEPEETIGILTVVWLKGTEGKEQMTTWMNKLENQQGMTCTKDETNPFWQ